ncbi:MAG: hypothetical protein JNK37_16760 [Verrucomicrobiales bacterium]|nr:hypothetical protein [Verrucomicrobiales bacterium]
MNDEIANQLMSYRNRLSCLDRPDHLPIWQNQPPLAFTTKVGQARALTNELAAMAGRQSALIKGNAKDKRREEAELEEAAYRMARAVVTCATDLGNLALAGRYDQTLTAWRKLRDEALIQRARLLEQEAGELATGADAALAADYGITPASVAALKKEADDYQSVVNLPQGAIDDRVVLTRNLPIKSREVATKFDELADLILQFKLVPGGAPFVELYFQSDQILDRGHGPRPKAPDGENGPTDPSGPSGPSAPPAPTPDTPPAG